MLQVPFFICRYLLLNIQVLFSTRQQAIQGTVLFTPDLLTPHTAFPSLPATVPLFWNVSTHFFYPCAHSVVASSTRCHLNRRKLNTYRATCPPSWENGTWQVPSQLSHRVRRQESILVWAPTTTSPLSAEGHKKGHICHPPTIDRLMFWNHNLWPLCYGYMSSHQARLSLSYH